MRRRSDGLLVPYYTRAEIEDGALDAPAICWIKDPIDLLFIQIQGSARVRLEDGTTVRINYDGYNGQPYTPVGRVLIERGEVPREQMSMERIRAWMNVHPDEAKVLRDENRSYVFFRIVGLSGNEEARGAQGLPLTPGRSIAVDSALHAYGTPFFIQAALPLSQSGGEHRLPSPDDCAGHRFSHSWTSPCGRFFWRGGRGWRDRRPAAPSGRIYLAGTPRP